MPPDTLPGGRCRTICGNSPEVPVAALHPALQTNTVCRIALTGFMGAGKTVVGHRLAARIGWTFLDVDEEIVRTAGRSIADIFADCGEKHFRRLEHDAIRLALGLEHRVIALGGGAVETDSNRELLSNDPGTLLIYLEAPFATLVERCDGQRIERGAPRRPVFENAGKLEDRFLRRKPFYEAARWVVPTAGRTPDDVADQIVHRLRGSV